jgi:hypothetical protein
MLTSRHALAQRAENRTVTDTEIRALLEYHNGVTFAALTAVTQVKTAARHKHLRVQKVSWMNVQLFSGLRPDTNPYLAAVKRVTGREDFELTDTYFEHTECWSIVEHKTQHKLYLYCIVNRAESKLFIDSELTDKAAVAELLTDSARERLLNPSSETFNKTNGVTHTVVPRTIMLASIVELRANNQVVRV